MNKRSLRCLGVVAILVISLIMPAMATARPLLPNVTPDMQTDQYWISKLINRDQLIMNRAKIAAFNKEIIKQSPTKVDLNVYPQKLDKKTLTSMLLSTAFPDDHMYSSGNPVDASFYKTLQKQLNIGGLQEENIVRYAFSVKRANIRTFPTSRGVFYSPNDRHFDNFQETIVDPGEPLFILHQSLDAQWYYVQMHNYRGWMASSDVAIASTRKLWLSYITRPNFLIVTGKNLTVKTSETSLFFEMGAKLPLVKKGNISPYTIEIPTRDTNGMVIFKQVVLPLGADVSVGYLPYTRANILRQAFKLQDTSYGWGGLYKGVDCSSYIMDIYRTFGIMLPRNADEQETSAGKRANLDKLPRAAKAKIIHNLKPGAAIYMDGHVMLYVGEENGYQYIIHSLGSYGDDGSKNADGTLERVSVMKVIVSDVNLTLRSGRTFLDAFTGTRQFEF
jgi:hypothetical protein